MLGKGHIPLWGTRWCWVDLKPHVLNHAGLDPQLQVADIYNQSNEVWDWPKLASLLNEDGLRLIAQSNARIHVH